MGRLKAPGCNTTVTSLLLNCSTSVPGEMVEHRVNNGFNVWRRLSHHYLPLARDLHNIVLHDWYDLRPVAEANADSFVQGGA